MSNKKKVIDIEEVKEKSESVEIEETKEKEITKKPRKTGLPKLIFNVIFWSVFIVIAAIWITDYFQVRNNKDPKFCLTTTIHEYADGTVEECKGLGYNVYTYNRTSMATGKEFVAFFIKMKEN